MGRELLGRGWEGGGEGREGEFLLEPFRTEQININLKEHFGIYIIEKIRK